MCRFYTCLKFLCKFILIEDRYSNILNMTRLFGLSIVIEIVMLMASLSCAQQCQDQLLSCSSYRLLCNNTIIREKCQATCNTCLSDPCTPHNGVCTHLCSWINGEKVCSCLPGFRLAQDNHSCEDIDECTHGPNPCSSISATYCVNTVGSYSCQTHQCNEAGSLNYYRSGKCCKVTNSSCGTTATIQERLMESSERSPRSRVFGGRAAAMSSWPWQAQILLRGFHHCGASLIANQWLVGAAHCFAKYSHRSMLVYLGLVNGAHVTRLTRSTQEQRRIAEVYTPRSYNLYNNDIALIRLSRPVEFNDLIKPICLPCGEEPTLGEECWVTGFGRTEFSGIRSSDFLREVDVPIVSNKECSKSYKGIYQINETQMICAGYSKGRKDACVGDSGGPLACQRNDSCEWYLSGVTAFGKGCGLPDYYGVYTNVINYEAWIREIIGENATGLCRKLYNPCRGKRNVDDDCYSKLDDCATFPYYMESNCALACCQLQNKEITNCYDNISICKLYSDHCHNPIFKPFLKANCKKTCNVC